MKAVIPAAGFGTRLRPLTYARPKPVLPVGNRPIICHAVQNLADAGIREIGIVVSPVTREAIQAAVLGIEGARIEFIEQPEMLGLGHAVMVARDFVGESDFCVYLGDNLFEHGVLDFRRAFEEQGADAAVALVEVADARAFGVAVLDERGQITRLVEKPAQPPSNLAVAGVYCFRASVFGVLETLAPSPRGEYEITDAIQRLIEQGGRVAGQRVRGWWKDTGRPLDLIEANRLVLEGLRPGVLGEISGSRLTGRVVVEPGAVVRNSVVMGPATIASGARIENAYIGPFTSVGRGSVIENAEVEYSVIDEGAEIRDMSVRLQECLIGLRARVIGHGELPRVHRLVLSDTSLLEFGC